MDREQAARIVDSLLYNLDDRRGFHLDNIPVDILLEWRERWIEIVQAGGDGKRLHWIEGK